MLVLASQSPRRREILTAAGFTFKIRIAAVPEVPKLGEAPSVYVQRLARSKAEGIPIAQDEVAIGADTIVVCDDAILEKPRDTSDAKRMLDLLSGREHEVLTGVCVRSPQTSVVEYETTVVRFVPLTRQEIEAYVQSGEHMDKAGAYGIQGRASKFIDRIEGCYFNVVGLPVARVYRLLKRFGVQQ